MTRFRQIKVKPNTGLTRKGILPKMNVSLLKKCLAAATVSIFAIPCGAALSVKDGQLIDANGQPVLLRGVTINHDLAPDKTIQSLKDAATLGANSAQIEFKLMNYSVNPTASELRQIVMTCKDQKLVCVLEPNDVAGFGSAPGSVSPTGTVTWWHQWSNEFRGSEDFIIIGLGNQHFDDHVNSSSIYRSGMEHYIQELKSRLPGNFVVMIDGSGWSQDVNRSMHYVASRVADNSILKSKVIFSVDFFDQYVNSEAVRDYIEDFKTIGAPLVVGGFAPAPYYHPRYQGSVPQDAPRLPVEAVMQYAQQFNVGYFAWSWGGNNNSSLDLVSNWDPAALTAWGNIAFNDPNGIKATAKTASIFTDGSSSSSSSSSSGNNSPIAKIEVSPDSWSCDAVTLSGKASVDPDGDVLTYFWEFSGGLSSSISTQPGITLRIAPSQQFAVQLTVRDGRGGVSRTSVTVDQSQTSGCGSSSISSVQSSVSSSRALSSVRPGSSSSLRAYSSLPSSLAKSSVPSSAKSSSSAMAQGNCTYVVKSEWGNGFTASIRVKNIGTQPINGWNVNWQYADGSEVTSSWNAKLTGNNPYSASNVNWNATIRPGQTAEFGFQGKKPNGPAQVPVVTGSICQ